MKLVRLLLVVTCMVSIATAQKLFFKSNKVIQEELKELKKVKDDVIKGFGFVERKYFNVPKTPPPAEQKVNKDLVVTCPDNRTTCPDGNTCCQVSLTAYGCCPLQKATCCLDKKHCCPFGTKCDFGRQACISGDTVVPWFEKTPGTPINENTNVEVSVGTVQCPDGEHECPDGHTCCRSAEGYSCCPLPHAVCCSDQVHCCPANTVCDLTHGKCIPGDGSFVAMFKKQYSKMTKIKSPVLDVTSVPCDDKHACPTANTCCLLPNGEWGCCPKLSEKVKNVKCDSTHECPSENTCCRLSSGQWGCCPLPEAVCCSDGVHCCPAGDTCDVSQGKCNRGNIQTGWFKKQPAIKVGGVKCDSTHECPNGNTCCKLASGQWGCCPLPEAVCCSDGVHCCPAGDTCDVSQGKCNRGNIQTDWFKKQPAIKFDGVKCDSTHECPDGNTCCELASGQWGCCPLPEAVCCNDGVHCCPAGDTCDVSQGKCNRGDIQTDWLKKQPAIKVDNVECDSTHSCPSGNTCCKLASGQWGCCPLPEAVCCSDGLHCCPYGTTCDTSAGKCNRNNIKSDLIAMSAKKEEVNDVICPDGSECRDGETCCKMGYADSYGCCPMPNAVCCDDGQHCCPHSYKCNIGSGMCVKGMLKLPWIRTNVYSKHNSNRDMIKINDIISSKKNRESVTCSDQTVCPDQYSCCPNGKGGYNCCPMPAGVCCSDNIHCCPHGYICDEEPGICRIPELDKTSSEFIRKLGSKKAIPHS